MSADYFLQDDGTQFTYTCCRIFFYDVLYLFMLWSICVSDAQMCAFFYVVLV